MLRRGFLAASALGTGTAALGCGGASLHARIGDAQAAELAARLARGRRLLEEQPFGTLVSGPARARPDLREHVLRLNIESLLVLDVLRSIPRDARLPPSLGAALGPMLPRLDRAIHTNHTLLSRMPMARANRLDGALAARPSLAMDATDWLDAGAAHIGIPAAHRLHIRQSTETLANRMRSHSTRSVVRDYAAKLDRVVTQTLPLAPELAESTVRVVDALWQDGSEEESVPIPPPPVPARRPDDVSTEDRMVVPLRFSAQREMESPTEPVQWNESWASPGDEEIRLGAIMLPLGLVTCGITLIVGLIVLLTGVAQNAGWDGTTHADDALVE